MTTALHLHQTPPPQPSNAISTTYQTHHRAATQPPTTGTRIALFYTGPADRCDNYAICGVNSNCDVNNSPTCECLQGFIPKSLEKWNSQNWTDGCVRKVNLDCGNSDGFLKYQGMKLPDTSISWFDRSMNLEECENICLRNSSCSTYANLDVRDGGSGCLLWFNNIVDVRELTSGGQDFYIRVAASELGADTLFSSAFLILAFPLKHTSHNKGLNKMQEFLLGTLTNDQDIAVKRLCNNSGQGPKEFINEVVLIANLQHRNLVKLLGCCIQDDERILIYELMTNRIEARKSLLNWAQRFQIICGIARGLLYLHEDSRLRIIHRDLKTSNILLDESMNPKISDFGLARTFGGDEVEGQTKRVVGTYGYISPEYAARGNFSVKSDVFSFGVIVLETVYGKKNREYFDDNGHDLLGHAWRLV
ncbi:G-type lectin S-receptor-like serine/threonine-protein kinase [Glycine soja]|uniref:non-specific serine/threonine protein kinase n=1 Tax=Glycine soja TaxID=3848 RepID=A0A445IB73_GLYSO|nr:G-type lectin S-receptor-like serine/threonine-protein kinase [Glycine soja]